MSAKVAASADVDGSATIGAHSAVWENAQVRAHATIGSGVVIGRGAYIGVGVQVGDNCKIQNYALIYDPAVLEAGVFVGPGAILTNDRFPRAVAADGRKKLVADWTPVGVTCREGASIGAGAVCVAPLEIGRWAVVAAGAVVTADVPDFALVAGVPSRRIGWVGKAGVRLVPLPTGDWTCPQTGARYRDSGGMVEAGGTHEG